jgi:hypothetical protein
MPYFADEKNAARTRIIIADDSTATLHLSLPDPGLMYESKRTVKKDQISTSLDPAAAQAPPSSALPDSSLALPSNKLFQNRVKKCYLVLQAGQPHTDFCSLLMVSREDQIVDNDFWWLAELHCICDKLRESTSG